MGNSSPGLNLPLLVLLLVPLRLKDHGRGSYMIFIVLCSLQVCCGYIVLIPSPGGAGLVNGLLGETESCQNNSAAKECIWAQPQMACLGISFW